MLESRGLLQPNARSAFILAMLWCCAIAAFAMSTSYPLALVLLFAAGFLELSFYSMAQSLVQLHAPAAIRGRVIGLYSVAALGLRTFSGITIGIAGGVIGIHWSLSLSAIILLVVLAVLFIVLAPQRATPAGSSSSEIRLVGLRHRLESLFERTDRVLGADASSQGASTRL